MKNTLVAGIGLAVAVWSVTYALHLLNEPSDLAVTGGYLILLVVVAGAVEGVRLWRKRR